MKTKNIELKDEITVEEYKAWLTGLLRGKGSQLPDLNDWKVIKKMTDKIVPDVVEVPQPTWPQYPSEPYKFPDPQPWWLTQPSTCLPEKTWVSSYSTYGTNDNKIAIGSSAAASIDDSKIAVGSNTYAGWGPYGGPVGEIKIGNKDG